MGLICTKFNYVERRETQGLREDVEAIRHRSGDITGNMVVAGIL